MSEKKKKAQTKKKQADVLKLQDLLSRLPKAIIAKETSKGTVLRSGSLYIMHVKQSPQGILYFLSKVRKASFISTVQKRVSTLKANMQPTKKKLMPWLKRLRTILKIRR
jgi:hypothetical protein